MSWNPTGGSGAQGNLCNLVEPSPTKGLIALKDTSLGAYITAPGLTFIGASIQDEFPASRLQTWTVIAVIYIGVNLSALLIGQWMLLLGLGFHALLRRHLRLRHVPLLDQPGILLRLLILDES